MEKLERCLSLCRKIVIRDVLTFPVPVSNENEVREILTSMLDLPEWHKAQNMAFYSADGVCVVASGWEKGVTCSVLLHVLSVTCSLWPSGSSAAA